MGDGWAEAAQLPEALPALVLSAEGGEAIGCLPVAAGCREEVDHTEAGGVAGPTELYSVGHFIPDPQ